MRAGDMVHMSLSGLQFKKPVCNAAMHQPHGFANGSAFAASQTIGQRIERMHQL